MLKVIHKKQFIKEANVLAKAGEPFFFSISFDLQSCILVKLSELQPHEVAYIFNGKTNLKQRAAAPSPSADFYFQKFPESYENYLKGYRKVTKKYSIWQFIFAQLYLPHAYKLQSFALRNFSFQ